METFNTFKPTERGEETWYSGEHTGILFFKPERAKLFLIYRDYTVG